MIRMAPCKDSITAEKSAQLIVENVFRHHGLPKDLVSDRDPRFTATFWKELWSILGTKLRMSSARHPQTDGQTERVNRVIEDILRSFCDKYPKQWGNLLPLVEFAINQAVHSSTGHSPFYINYLKEPRTPITLAVPDSRRSSMKSVAEFLTLKRNVLRYVRDQMAESQDKQKDFADRRGNRRQIEQFRVGEEVMLSTQGLPTKTKDLLIPRHHSTKLEPRFVGPFKIEKKVSDTSYRLQLPKHIHVHPVFYIGLLRKYKSVGTTFKEQSTSETTETDSKEINQSRVREDSVVTNKATGEGEGTVLNQRRRSERLQQKKKQRLNKTVESNPKKLREILQKQAHYVVKKILDRRMSNRRPEYLIHWQGYDRSEATREPRSSLIEDIPELINEFDKNLRSSTTRRHD